MQKRFDKIMEGLFPGGGAVLLAVSGGMDSMCLADLFLQAAPPRPFGVAHANFGLRGADSRADEDLVRAWCEAAHVPFHVRSFDTEAYAREHGVSIEMAARGLRYRWFARLCRDEGYLAVVTAHHADDNAETLVLNLLRGTGIQGLRGMPAAGKIPVPGSDVPLLRPLLSFRREEIAAHVLERGLAYREDTTNAENLYRRNRIRNQVFPVFRSINPSFEATFSSAMRHVGEAAEAADAYFEAHKADLLRPERAGAFEVDTRTLLGLRAPGYLLYRLLSPYGFEGTVLQTLSHCLDGAGNRAGKVFLSETHRLSVASDRLIVKPLPAADPVPTHPGGPEPESRVVDGPGCYSLRGRTFRVEVVEKAPSTSLHCPAGLLLADADALPFPFVLRGWEAGDWFRPLGLGGRKKLSDLFVDLKYALPEKERAVVAVSDRRQRKTGSLAATGCHVDALLCVRMDEALKVSPSTRRLLRLSEISG